MWTDERDKEKKEKGDKRRNRMRTDVVKYRKSKNTTTNDNRSVGLTQWNNTLANKREKEEITQK